MDGQRRTTKEKVVVGENVKDNQPCQNTTTKKML